MIDEIKTYYNNIDWGYLFISVNVILFVQSAVLGLGIGVFDIIFWTIMMQLMAPDKSEKKVKNV